MAQGASSVEQRLAEIRGEMAATLDALAYQADLPARMPAYRKALIAKVTPVASRAAVDVGTAALKIADTAATHLAGGAATAAKNASSSLGSVGLRRAVAATAALIVCALAGWYVLSAMSKRKSR